MHSVGLSSCCTSLRLSSSVLSARIWSSNEADNVIAGFCLDRHFAASENSGASVAFQCDCVFFANQPCAFANSDYGRFVLFEKLKNPFLLRFARMLAVLVRILKRRTDLKRPGP